MHTAQLEFFFTVFVPPAEEVVLIRNETVCWQSRNGRLLPRSTRIQEMKRSFWRI